MENIIGWLLLAVIIAAPVIAVTWLIRRNRVSEREYRDRLDYYQSQLKAAKDREQERWRQDRLKTDPTPPAPITVTGGGGGTSYTNSRLRNATPLPLTQDSDNSALRDLALLYAVNSLLPTASAAEPTAAIGHSSEDDRVVQDSFSSSDSSSSSDVSSDW